MKPKHSLTLFSLSLALMASQIFVSCRSTSEGSSLVYGLTLAPSGLDPHINASAELGIPLHSVYDTLVVRHHETYEFLPSLAQSWEISPDGHVYTFDLRRDVMFHDGTKFDAAAAVTNFEYILNPDHNSQKAAGMLGPVLMVTALDEFTLQLDLEEPFAPLLDSLSQVYLGMASPTALERWGPSEYQFHQVGTGPYRFIEYVPNDRIVLQKNRDYAWGPAIYENAVGSIDRIEFRFFEDEATRALAIERGEVDIIGEVPPQDARRLSDLGKYILVAVPIPGQPLQFFFNTQLEATDDPLVRKALIASVDRDRILSTVFGKLSPLARGALSAYPFSALLSDRPQSYDPDHARRLLDQAGWIDSSRDGIRRKGLQDLVINLMVPPWGSNPEVAQLIKVDWEAVGVAVNLEIAPGFGFLKQAQEGGEIQAIGLNFFGTDADLLRPFFTSEGFYNWSEVESDTLDALLNQAATETDMSMRSELYQEAIGLISEQALILPIRDYVNLVVHHESVSNLQFSAQGWFPYLIDLKLES